MAQAKQADEPSMEEILASIRRIISDEDEQSGGAATASAGLSTTNQDEAADLMGDSAEMSQDDLDKLFDMDDSDIGGVEDAADDDMAAAMAAAADDEDEDDVLELTEDFAVGEADADDDLAMVGEDEIAFVEKDIPADDDDADIMAGFDMDDVEEEAPVAVAPKPAPAPAAAPKPRATASVATAPIPDDLPEVDDETPLTSDMTGSAVHAAFDNLSNLFVGNQPQTMEELVREMLRPMLKAWLDQNLPVMVEALVKKEIERVTRRR